jgi:hypothetical protein
VGSIVDTGHGHAATAGSGCGYAGVRGWTVMVVLDGPAGAGDGWGGQEPAGGARFGVRSWRARTPAQLPWRGLVGAVAVRTRTVRGVRPRRSGGRTSVRDLGRARAPLAGVSGRPVAAWFCGGRRFPGHFRQVSAGGAGRRKGGPIRRPPAAAGRTSTAGPRPGGRRPGPATALLEAPTEPSRRVRHASADRRAGRWRARVADDLAGPGGRRGAGRSAAVGGQLALVGAAGPVGAGLAVGVAARWAAGPVGLQAGSPPGA